MGDMGRDEPLDEHQYVDVAGLEDVLDYQFGDPKLAEEALTHHSYYYPDREGPSYQRLEFVGDAVLNCLMAMELFRNYPDLAPGQLTRLRAVNVDTEKLARVAIKHGLHYFLRHKAPLEVQIEEFTYAISEFPVHSNGLVSTPKFLADMVEAILGAIFFDANHCLVTAWKVFKRLLEPLISPKMLEKHPVSELHELCQKKGLKLRFLNTWQVDHRIAVSIDGHVVGSATYGNRKETTQNRAAKDALDKIKATFIEIGANLVEESESTVGDI